PAPRPRPAPPAPRRRAPPTPAAEPRDAASAREAARAAAAAAETAATATAAPDTARAEQTDARGRRTRRTPEPPASTAAGAAAEELVQHRREIGRLGVLHRVDERLPPRALLGRDVEKPEPALDLGEEQWVEGNGDDRVEPRERDQVDAALAFAGGRHAVGGEEPEDLVRQLVRVAVLHLEDARVQVVEAV